MVWTHNYIFPPFLSVSRTILIEIEEDIAAGDENIKPAAGSPDLDGGNYIDDFEEDSEAEVGILEAFLIPLLRPSSKSISF